MASWVKRRYQSEKALDTAMNSVVEYYQFASMKAPTRPEDPASSPLPPPPLPPTPTDHPVPPSSPTPSPPPASSSSPPPSTPLSYAEWQSERAEMLALDQCAITATWRIGSTSLLTGALAMVYRHRQGRSKVQMALSGGGWALFTAALTWNVWGKQCANEFLLSEGRVADRGRAELRKEMEDHPLLIEYQQKHTQPAQPPPAPAPAPEAAP